jgi:hypothetical protein
MTPEEKAKELVEKFLSPTKVYHEHLGWVNYLDSAKECALIAIDEILNTIEYSSQADELSKVLYWEQVKNEINKL